MRLTAAARPPPRAAAGGARAPLGCGRPRSCGGGSERRRRLLSPGSLKSRSGGAAALRACALASSRPRAGVGAPGPSEPIRPPPVRSSLAAMVAAGGRSPSLCRRRPPLTLQIWRRQQPWVAAGSIFRDGPEGPTWWCG